MPQNYHYFYILQAIPQTKFPCSLYCIPYQTVTTNHLGLFNKNKCTSYTETKFLPANTFTNPHPNMNPKHNI